MAASEPLPRMGRVLLEMHGIVKNYGAVRANRSIDLIVGEQRVVGLLGENGSGKSTLMKILFGMIRPDSGRVVFDGTNLRDHTPHMAMAAGIGMIHQHFTLVDAMTVTENIMLGWDRAGGILKPAVVASQIEEASRTYGLAVSPGDVIAKLSFGQRQRVEIVKAILRGSKLLILDEPTSNLSPPEVAGGVVTIVAAVGVIVNLAATWVLAKANRQSLNVEGSFQHILTDLYAFIGTLIAGVVIMVTGFVRADPIASLFVAMLMIRSGWVLQRKALHVLLEGAPEDIVPEDVGRAMAGTESVTEVHDLHVWDLAPGHPVLTAHVLVAPHADCHAIRRRLELMLKERFHIGHTTLQVDHAADEWVPITGARRNPR